MKAAVRLFNRGTGGLGIALFCSAALAAGGATADHQSWLPAGPATYQGPVDFSVFSNPSANLHPDRLEAFETGNRLFNRVWGSDPGEERYSEVLGPRFNAHSCSQCHDRDGRGRPPASSGDRVVSLLLRLGVPGDDGPGTGAGRFRPLADPVLGHQLQDLAVEGVAPEGRIGVRYRVQEVRFDDGRVVRLRRPEYRVVEAAPGSAARGPMVSPRLPPPMIGLGLLEAVPEQDLLAMQDPEDADADGISGRVNRAWSARHARLMPGRFGWKASVVSLAEQVERALVDDLGITTPLFRCEQAGSRGLDCDAREPELDQESIDALTLYSRHLAVPRRRAVDDPAVRAGAILFEEIGCGKCHRPELTTRPDAAAAELSSLVIRPYTDLLLHDMGDGLADGMADADASGREWRTAPLWGIGLTRIVSGHEHYLHDGRARSVIEAILWHGGEAEAQRDRVLALSRLETRQLVSFVRSL